MTTAELVTGKIDWIKIRFPVDPKTIIEDILKLDIELCDFANGKLVYYDYNAYYSYGLIQIYTYKEAEFVPDSILQMSGQACDQFSIMLEHRSESWQNFLKQILSYENVEILRLDVALDDKNYKPYFKIEELIRKAKKGLYWSNGRDYTIHESKYKLTTGKTLNVGSRTSNLMFRIYDKAIERAKETGLDIAEYGSWNRVEIELKKEPANDLAYRISQDKDSLENLIRGVLREELRFFTDASKTKFAKSWDRFLQQLPPIKLKRQYELTTLEGTQRWLLERGGLAAYQAMVFLTENNALGDLTDLTDEYLEFSRGLSERIIAHLVGIGRTDLILSVKARTKIEKEGK